MKPGSQAETEIANYLEDARGFREPESINTITRHLSGYLCCTILGPLYSHKSILLEHVRQEVETTLKRRTVLVSVKAVECVASGGSYDVSEFLRDFGIEVARQFDAPLRDEVLTGMKAVKDEYTLSHRLLYCQSILDSDLVLLVDHLESARVRSLEALLRVLRQFFMQGQTRLRRPVIVAASSHRVASLSLGAGSPFNIAIPFIIKDLSFEESKRWVNHLAARRNSRISRGGIDRLWQAAGGDRYLLRQLFVDSVEISNKPMINAREIDASVARFEQTQIDSYAPIRATVRTIEDNPALLVTLLGLIRTKQKFEDPLLRSSSTVDDINLSGGMLCDATRSSLRIRNQIYLRELTRYFSPPRAAKVLAHNRRWDHAIRHLAQFPEHHLYLQEIILKAVSSSSSFEEAAKYIGYFLVSHFKFEKFMIFVRNEDEPVVLHGVETRLSYSSLKDSIGVKTEAVNKGSGLTFERGQDQAGNAFGLITLGDASNKLLSLALYDSLLDEESEEAPEVGPFLSEAAASLSRLRGDLERVGSYARDVSVWSHVSGLLDSDQYLTEVIKAALQVVSATKGSLYLWDFERNKLIVSAQSGFRDDLVDLVQLNKGEGYAGWVFQNRQPVILDDVWHDERTREFHFQEIEDLKAAICVPLQAWDHVFGVLCLDTTEEDRRFTEEDLSSLIAFADHAVQVILSHRLRQEFYNLSLVLNGHDVDEAKIFRFVVNSILRVFGMAAASMLLLEDPGDPAYSVTRKPLLVEAEGLSPGYKDVAPRLNGLTHLVLESKERRFVTNPEEPPGINPQALADGIKAQLCVPLMQEGEISGVLFVHYDRPHKFTEAEVRIMLLFANQVALAISNVNQRRELELTDKVAWMGLKWPDLGHDFTQSVGSFENSLKALVSRTRPGSKEQTAMRAVIDRVGELKEELLKIVADPYDHKPEWTNLAELLKEQLDQYLKTFPDVHLSFTCDGCAQVNVDPRWFEIIVKNLVSNSLKAMEREPEKTLSVNCVPHGQRVTVTVSNTGLAIPDHLQKRIFFEPIFNESKRRYGIGLFVTGRIISRYKGRIWIEKSESGKPTIAFSLPTGERPEETEG